MTNFDCTVGLDYNDVFPGYVSKDNVVYIYCRMSKVYCESLLLIGFF